MRSAQWRRLWLEKGGIASFCVLVMAAFSCLAGWTILTLVLGVVGVVGVLCWVLAS
jgi:hypothetical protein